MISSLECLYTLKEESTDSLILQQLFTITYVWGWASRVPEVSSSIREFPVSFLSFLYSPGKCFNLEETAT